MSNKAVPSGSTIAAIATPPGRGGVGIIRISGPDAISVISSLSTRKCNPEPRVATLDVWRDSNGQVLDQGIVLFFPGPASYTGEDVVELQGHGSTVLLHALLARLFELGCVPAQPGEFTRRAVENGKMDLSQAEAVVACIDAATVRACLQAQRQLQGAFGRHINELMVRLTSLVAHVEATLDFPEEEIPDLYFSDLRDKMLLQVVEPVRVMLASAPLGERLFHGATVAIIGAPNAGKSSLLNALSGRDRAIVSHIEGTTRDTLEVDFEVHGIPLRLVDTAGLRETDDLIEQEGVRRARETASNADVTLFVADATRPHTWDESVHADIFLMNKTDLQHGDVPEKYLQISVAAGIGLESLRTKLATYLGDMAMGDEGMMVTRERHRVILTEALEYIESGLLSLSDEEMLDVTAMQWRRAWALLGSILGIGDVDHILDRIFSEFCIGK
ncbi:tRNA uridine-5-carboxymethylaminomethyl(34) synthesis GTPase MnmE [Mariprofundus erugo]|uniref:tRNA modification GTPase MnmE n=1 Tax=Mariprofundus erugo TaxID=2528639 RepID=A0A5R9GSC0_9PROT|nr:tRNA uridine-5-carboxymethylaminomethyl(34) synthesis GTPase MnmE [Mariprofundus erugo]TLS68770.1 tRNA uridine-5-carboxymethylaminomethyl(34) synthesis GTPase MnmE [Mariprofundus erugo]TLS77540.1 tRNA uridine-5-carboxymethylaminomethyl(34) synthesis GTPase MnmE [Mariprofundus erugo]